jgi:hypothetical protein
MTDDKSKGAKGKATWPGMDYCNPRVKDFVHVGPQAAAVDLPGHNR